MSAARSGIRVFCSYANEDEAWLRKLEAHLSPLKRQGLLTTWYDRLIVPGTNWSQTIDAHLETASLILLLISADFFASDYCYGVEMQRALNRQAAGEVHVIPVLVRSVDWKSAPFASLQALPTNTVPLATWSDADMALTNVVAGIRRILEDLPLLISSIPRAALPSIWNIPYSRNSFFLGRDKVLMSLRTHLKAGQLTALSQPQAISGLGGIGKTQIALEYAYRFHQEYEVVFWAGAESQEALFSSYSELAALLALPEQKAQEQERIVKAVKIWLQRHQKWLLILDNADDLDMVSMFLPSAPGGHLLLTTRAWDMKQLAQRIVVDALPTELGALFLLRRAGLLATDALLEQAPSEEQTLALWFAEQMGGLPLALDQAGAYLEATGMHLVEYQRVYQQHRQVLHLQRRSRISDHPQPIATTWALSFQQIEQCNPAAAELLRLCAFLAPDAIPEEMITQGAPHLGRLLGAVVADPFQMGQAVEMLRLYSLVGRNPRMKTLSIHRLVQVTLRDSMDEATTKIWLERAIRIVKVVVEALSEDWDVHADQNRSERIYNQVQACIELLHEYTISLPEAVVLLGWAGFYLGQHGLFQQAQPLLEQTLQISEQMNGTEHRETGRAVHMLAWLYRRMGKYVEAESLLLRALTIYEQQLGLEHLDTATVQNVLGFLYMQQNRYPEAESLLLRALAIYEQKSGSEDLDTAYCLGNLAQLYTKEGKHNQAEQLCQRSLVIREQILGTEHPDTALSLYILGSLYIQQGRYLEAEPLLLRTLAIREQHLGPEHPRTAEILSNLAYLYTKEGKYDQAEQLCQRSLVIREQTLGTGHPDTAQSLYTLAFLYQSQKKYAEAEQLYQHALAIYKQNWGQEHPDTQIVREYYISLLLAMEHTEEAKALEEGS